MEKEELSIIKEKLGINDWLELVKEDKNLNGAYISIAQYIYLLETQLKKQQEIIDKVSTRLEYFLIGNLKYQSSQEEFIKLLNILEDKEV